MPTFTTNTATGVNTAGLWPTGAGVLFLDGLVVSATSTQFVLLNQLTGTFVRYTGSGFTYSNPIPGFTLITGGTYSQVDIVDATNTTSLATLTGVSFTLTAIGAAASPLTPYDTTFTGGAGVDFLTGFDGNDTFIGGGNTDILSGGAGNDTFVYFTGSEIPGEVINGGANTDTIRLGTVGTAATGTTYDFQTATLTSIEKIDFGNTTSAAEIVLGANHIGGALNGIIGSARADLLTIKMGTATSVDLGFIGFTSWSAADRVVIDGDADGEAITGSQMNDQINGGAGNDTIKGQGGADELNGGAGDDIFNYDANGPVAGELVDGGDDTDSLRLVNGQAVFDFRTTTLASIEILDLKSFGNSKSPDTSFSTAYFLVSQVAPGALAPTLQIQTADLTNIDGLIFEMGTTTSFDISGFTYLPSGSELGSVTVKIIGDADAETITGEDVGGPTIFFTIDSGGGADIVNGGAVAETIFAGAGHDVVNGGDGNDTLVGNADIFAQESDTLNGGLGNDTIYGEFTDTIIGGAGTDFLYAVNSFNWSIDLGATGIEWMFADFGDDTINAATQTASVEIYGSGGIDIITGSAQGDLLWAGVGNDIVSGGGGDDMLFGDVGADSLSGGDGNDRLYVDSTDTLIDGGTGFDALYITSGPGMTFNMLASAIEFVADFANGNDTLNGTGLLADMTVYAGGGVDSITGGSGNDFLWGEAGGDFIFGSIGNDTLVGGIGADAMAGGVGTDIIYLNSGGGTDGALDRVVFGIGWGTDFVFDFVHGEDKLDLTAFAVNFAALVITNESGHAYVHIGTGTDLIAVANNGGLLTAGDFLF